MLDDFQLPCHPPSCWARSKFEKETTVHLFPSRTCCRQKESKPQLDFPCFLQNKYLFATKAAGRMRHVPLTLKACVFVPAAVEVWSSSECYLGSGWAPSPPACQLTSSATCTKQREEGSPGSPAGIHSKWKAKWVVGLPLGVAPCTAPSR